MTEEKWTDYPLVLNSELAAKLIGVHLNTIKKLAKNGEIPARRIGRNWRYSRDELREWLKGRD